MSIKPIAFRPSALALSLLCMGVATSPVFAQDLTPAQKKQVDSMIEDLDRVLNGGAEKNNTRALATCQSALKSTKATYEFFMEATKELDFDQAGKREADWREWKERNEDRCKSSEHLAARQYQLRYLVLTLEVMIAEDPEAAIKKGLPELIEFYDDVAGSFDKLEQHHRVLSESVLDSVFAKRLKLNVSLKRDGAWVYSPLPVSTAYEQLILPAFREQKNHRALQAAWEKRIMQESKTMAAEEIGRIEERLGPGAGGRGWSRDPREREREERREESRQQQVSEGEFKAIRLPELLWGKELDGLKFGSNRSASFAALGRILREHITHPEAMNWLDELKTLAKSS